MVRADLHTHSYFSDGSLSPTQLVHAAHIAGINMLALTDHDSIEGLTEATVAAQTYGIQLINGVEISTQWIKPKTGLPTSIHIVGLNIQNLALLQHVLEVQQAVRGKRTLEICARLEKHLKKNPLTDILDTVEGKAERITRSHIANWLVTHGIVQKHQQAFDRWLGEGKPAYVPLAWMNLAETIDVITQSGGVAVLAHPVRYKISATYLRQLVADFKSLGGHGIELPYHNDPSGTRDMIYRLIKQHELMVSTASDFHGAQMPWHKLGCVPALKEEFTPIWHNWGYRYPLDKEANTSS